MYMLESLFDKFWEQMKVFFTPLEIFIAMDVKAHLREGLLGGIRSFHCRVCTCNLEPLAASCQPTMAEATETKPTHQRCQNEKMKGL